MERHQGIPKKALGPREKLGQLIKDLDKDHGLYESISPSEWSPLHLFLPNVRKPRHTLFVTKQSVITRLLIEEAFPRDSVVLWRYGLPTDRYLREICTRLSETPSAIFIGDLDPLDIHVYLALSRGRPRVKLKYGGLNDACLSFCERHLKRGRYLESPMFRMDAYEKRHFDILDSMVDVAAIVGERSRNLLRKGLKLELEGATNKFLFNDRHLESLLKTILRSASVP